MATSPLQMVTETMRPLKPTFNTDANWILRAEQTQAHFSIVPTNRDLIEEFAEHQVNTP